MYILGFETTGPICSVALLDLDNPNRVFVMNGNEPMSHLKSLTDNARKLMADCGVSVNDIAAVAASIGPGSFTGIRIGVTSARAVAQTIGVPCVAVPTLEVFRTLSKGCMAVPIFNARRGQVYGAIFSETKDVLAPGPYMLEDVLEELKKYTVGKCSDGSADVDGSANSGASADVDGSACAAEFADNGFRIIFYGDGVDAYANRLNEFKEEFESMSIYGSSISEKHAVEFAPEEARYQTADLVVQFAAEKYKRGETATVEELLPDYMRKAEAEQKLEDGTLQKLREEKLARLMAGN